MLHLQFGIKQQQTLTPQLQQAIYVLQLPTQALQHYLQEELNSNPLLELEEQKAVTVEVDEPYIPYAPSQRFTEPNSTWDNHVADSQTLQDHLKWQLELASFQEEEFDIALAIIDAIDEDGFLKRDELNIADDELVPVLTKIQAFEPVGVAARDISECLLLQLKQLPESTKYIHEAAVIIESYLKKLAIRDYAVLQSATGLAPEELECVVELIRSLNPRPGAEFASQKTQYIVPDVILSQIANAWKVTLNESVLPKLSLNQEFASVIQNDQSGSEVQAYKPYLQDAKLLIKSVENRQETLLKVSQYIVQQQQAFFEHGEQAMKPMVLKDVADELGFHESTISRATTGKYLLAPNGLYELKYFFSSHVGSSDGNLSATAIKANIKNLIAEESLDKPLSDSAITNHLSQQGIKIARRTVTKYREAMMIPAAKLRSSSVNATRGQS